MILIVFLLSLYFRMIPFTLDGLTAKRIPRKNPLICLNYHQCHEQVSAFPEEMYQKTVSFLIKGTCFLLTTWSLTNLLTKKSVKDSKYTKKSYKKFLYLRKENCTSSITLFWHIRQRCNGFWCHLPNQGYHLIHNNNNTLLSTKNTLSYVLQAPAVFICTNLTISSIRTPLMPYNGWCNRTVSHFQQDILCIGAQCSNCQKCQANITWLDTNLKSMNRVNATYTTWCSTSATMR